jgi:hypothetical protein
MENSIIMTIGSGSNEPNKIYKNNAKILNKQKKS